MFFIQQPNADRMINSLDPSGMIVCVTPPDEDLRPTEMFAEGGGNMK